MFHNEGAEVVRLAGGSRFELLADGPDTGGAVSVNRLTLDVGAVGAREHFHALATEAFYVLGGVLEFVVDQRRTSVAAGGLLVVPPHTPHAFGAASGSAADVLVVMTPGAERFGYFRHLGRIAAGTDVFESLLPWQERYDVHFTG